MKTEDPPPLAPAPTSPTNPGKAETSAHPTEQETAPAPPPPKRRLLMVVIGAVGAALALVFLIPWVLHSLHTVSTDDAYVNSYVTFVAPRVAGQVARVLVEDNNRVEKGTLRGTRPRALPGAGRHQTGGGGHRAGRSRRRQRQRARAIGQVRSARFKLVRAIEDVDNQVALIRSRAAAWEQSKADAGSRRRSSTAPSTCSPARSSAARNTTRSAKRSSSPGAGRRRRWKASPRPASPSACPPTRPTARA